MIGALGASFLGAMSQSSANKQNYNIAQMNNQWAEKMMDKQNQYNIEQWQREADYNTEMWNKTNEYNSASSQVQRYKDAGLNPALMMGGQNAGVAQSSSAPSGNSVGLPSPTPAHMQAYDFRGLSTAINEAFLLEAERSRKQAETDWFKTQSSVAAAKAAEEVRGMALKNDFEELAFDTNLSIKNEQYLSELQQRLNFAEQQKLIRQQAIHQQLINENLPDKLAMEVAVMASQRDLNEFNSDVNVGKFIEALKKRGINLSNWQEKAIFGALLIAKAVK